MNRLSLRGRLTVVTVAVVATGLAAASVVTSALLRRTLIDRVDRQLEGVGVRLSVPFGEIRSTLPTPPAGQPPGGLEPPGPAFPVVIVQVLGPSGTVEEQGSFGFGDIGPPPRLPNALPGSSTATSDEQAFLTLSAQDGSRTYRVLAVARGRGEGTFVISYPLDEVSSTVGRLLLVEAIVSALVLVGAAVLALGLVRVGFRPLTKIEETADQVAAGDLSHRVGEVQRSTEVGRLAAAIDGMLDRIEASFAERQATEDRLRRFVADASHELRTPLTSIGGYAELLERTDVTTPDAERSTRRIREESERMRGLVEELLELARLDDAVASGRPIPMGSVDLTKLARDVVADAQAAAPDHVWVLNASSPVVVHGDASRLCQVLTNLIANVRSHTPAGTRASVSVGRDDAGATVTVSDDGPGMPSENAIHAFDRFWRADPARGRGTGNTGLGLAIVRAIVEAHGGTVALETSPDAGVRVSIRLPFGPRSHAGRSDPPPHS